MSGQNNPEQATVVDTGAHTPEPSVPEGWRSLDDIPDSDDTVEGLLSNGAIVDAEYWEGPDERPDWSGWAFDMLGQLVEHDWRQELDLIAWRLPNVGDAKLSSTEDEAATHSELKTTSPRRVIAGT